MQEHLGRIGEAVLSTAHRKKVAEITPARRPIQSVLRAAFCRALPWFPVLSLSTLLAAGPEPAGKAPEKAKAGKEPSIEWLSLDAGLERARKKYLPSVLLFEDAAVPLRQEGENADKGPVSFASQLSSSRLRSELRRFALIRLSPEDLKKEYPASSRHGVSPPAPRTVGEALELAEGSRSVVILSFWEEVVIRHTAELPRLEALRKELVRVAKVNEVYAQNARRVEPALEKSRYAFQLKNQREAVMKIRDFESEKAQTHMDPVLKDRIKEVIKEYRTLAEVVTREAERLDQERKYLEAIDAYDKLMKDFPFSDIIRDSQKAKTELLRKLSLGGKGRGPGKN